MQSVTLEVRVQPRSSRNGVVVLGEGRLRVYVSAPPEGGKANKAVIALLAARLGAPQGPSGAGQAGLDRGR